MPPIALTKEQLKWYCVVALYLVGTYRVEHSSKEGEDYQGL